MTDETKVVDLLSHYFPREFRGVYPSSGFQTRSLTDIGWSNDHVNYIIFKTYKKWGMRFSAIHQSVDGTVEYFDPWGKDPPQDVAFWLSQNIQQWTVGNHKYLLPHASPLSAAFCVHYIYSRYGSGSSCAEFTAEFGDNLKKNEKLLLYYMPYFKPECEPI